MSSRLILLFLLLSVTLSAQSTRLPFEACDSVLLCTEFRKILDRTYNFLDNKEGGKAYRQLKALEACTQCPEHRDNLDALSGEIIRLFEEQNNSLQDLIDQAEQQNEELAATVNALQSRTRALNEEREKVNQQLAINEEMTREALVNNYMRRAREAFEGEDAIGRKDATWLTDFTYHYVDSTHHSVRLMMHDLLYDRIVEELPYDLYDYADVDWEEGSDQEQVEVVLSVSWSTNGQWLAVGTSEGRLLIFSATGELVLEKPVNGYLTTLTWKPNEPTLVYLRNSQQAGIVSLINDSWEARPVAYKFDNAILEMVWAPTGEELAVATDYNELFIWDPESPDSPSKLGTHEATISDIAWSPDGTQLVASDHSGAVSFWMVEGAELRFRRSGHSDYARTVDWHPSGEYIISGGDDNKLLYWDTLGQITNRQEFSTWIMEGDFSLSGESIALTTLDQELIIINSTTGEQTYAAILPTGVQKAAWREEVSTGDIGGDLLLGFREDATFRLEDAGLPQTDAEFSESNGDLAAGFITRLKWSADGNYLAYGKDYELVIIAPEEITRFDLVGASILDLSWHPGLSSALPQTNFLATVGSDNQLVIWDVPAKSAAHQIELESTSRALGWSPDGQYLAVGSDLGELKIFNNQLEFVQQISVHDDYIRALSWSPNGRYIATASDDQTTVIFDVPNNKIATQLRGHEDWVREVLWLDDTHLATGADDAKTILWEWDSTEEEARELQTLERISGYHQAIAFMPQSQGGVLAVGSTEAQFALWNIEPNWRARFDTIFQQEYALTGMDWHPRGSGLAFSGYGTVPYNLGWGNAITPAYEGTSKPVRTINITDALLGSTVNIANYFYLPELKVEPYLYDQIAWSSDERWLGVIQTFETDLGGRRADLHDMQQKEIVRSLEFEAGYPSHLLFSPDGRYLAVSPEEGDIAVLPTASASDTIYLGMATADSFMDWTWSNDSRYLAVLDRSFRVHIHDLQTGDVQQLDGGPAEYDRASITFYPKDNRWIYLFTQQGIYELDRESTQEGQRVYEPPGYIPGSYSERAPHGEWLADGTEVLYEQANNPPQIIQLAPGQVNLRASFGENENLHAWSSTGGVMHELEPMPLGKGEYTSRELEFPRVWNLRTGEIKGRLQTARRQLIESMVVSSDGQYLLTIGAVLEESEGKYLTSSNPFLIVWELDEQEEVLELEIPAGISADFSPNENYLYVFYDNGRVMLWPLNAPAIGEFLANSGKDRYLEQLFPGENTGFVDRIIDWELESGINFREQQNFELLHQREGARIRRNWSTYFADQVWLEESDEAADRHFNKATSLHLELGSQSLRSHPIDSSSLVNIWFEQTYYAIQNRKLSRAAGHIQKIETIEPQSIRMQMLRDLLDWHRGNRKAAIRSLFSTRREALVREMNNWERRDLTLKDKGLFKRYIALATGDQDPLTPMIEPTLISTIPSDIDASLRDSLIVAYYATNMQHDGFNQTSSNRYQQFLSEAVAYLNQRWENDPSNLEIADGLRTYNYELQVLAYQKGKLAKAQSFADRNVEIATILLAQGATPIDNYQWLYLDALAESIFIRLLREPDQAAELREEILAARAQYPNVEVPLYLIFQQAHCELALGKTKSAYHLYYELCRQYPYATDEILTQIQREMEPVAPDRLPDVERVFGLYKEYREAVNDYEEGLYRLEDPATAIEPEVLNENYWSAHNSGKHRYETALILESADMMPIGDLHEEMEEFNRISAQYAHVLLLDGSWKEMPALLTTSKEYLPQYNWPKAMEAVLFLMQGDWSASQRMLRDLADLPNDGYLAEEYGSLRAYLLNLPSAITESSAYQERKEDWERILNR